MLLMGRWIICIVATLVAMVLDIKYKKIFNVFNYVFLLIGILYLIFDYKVEYIYAFIIASLLNIFLVNVLYMGGDAKLMINIALLVGFSSIYIFLCFLVLMAIDYTIKIVRNYRRYGKANTGVLTICGPFFFVATVMVSTVFLYILN